MINQAWDELPTKGGLERMRDRDWGRMGGGVAILQVYLFV